MQTEEREIERRESEKIRLTRKTIEEKKKYDF